MTTPTANMKAPLDLGFKLAEGKFQVFRIIGWKVRTTQIVECDSAGKWSCNCQPFRFTAECSHVDSLKSGSNFTVYAKEDWRKGAKQIRWEESSAIGHCIVLDHEGSNKRSGVVSYAIGDLTLMELTKLMTEDKVSDEVVEKAADEKSFLNPKRIFEECKVSVNEAVSIADDLVTDKGNKVKALTLKDIPDIEEFDDDLGDAIPDIEGTAPVAVHSSSSTIPWDKIKRPKPSTFFVHPENWEQLCYAAAKGGNLLLTGPSGCGKSELVYLVAQAMGLTCEAFNFGATQEPRTMLIGQTNFDKEKGTWFSESRFVKAIKQERGVILLDELTRDRGASAHNIILPLLDRQGYLALDEHEDAPIIKKGAEVAFLATANIGAQYTGTEALDAALRNRFGGIVDLTWPPKEFEIKILLGRCKGLRAGDASTLVTLANNQRRMVLENGDFMETGEISTRMLIEAGTRIAAGMTLESALTFSIINHFSNEGGDQAERAMLRQLYQKNA